MIRIDAHQHIWRLSRGDYGWLTPDLATLYRDFMPADLEPLLRARGIAATILVQAAPTEAETDFLLDQAGQHDWIAGVVGWTDLSAPDAPMAVARLARRPKLVALRPMLQDLAEPDWILSPAVTPALTAMRDAGLVFDALVRQDQLDAIVQLAARHTDLAIILDHAGKPDISAAPTRSWHDAVRLLGARANVAVKLSGLLTEAPRRPGAAQIAPFLEILFEAFGTERILWGSDWPVLTLAADYPGWAAITDTLLAPLGATARSAILGGNAARIYGLTNL